MPNPENIIGKGFKKGQSGNPTGRKPNAPLFAPDMRSMLSKPYRKTGKEARQIRADLHVSYGIKNPTVKQVLIYRMIEEAIAGGRGANQYANMLIERVDGKAPQPIVGGDESAPPVRVAGELSKEANDALQNFLKMLASGAKK